jgi:type II secretory pathway pseudopilin PulG
MKLNPFFKKIKAYTLVEILVVLGLFSAISTLSLGALFNAQSINSRLQETQAILDNVNLSVQTITRDIRFGSDFYCATVLPATPSVVPAVRKNCVNGVSSGGTILIFKPADANNDLDRVAYYVKNGILYQNLYPYNATSTVLQLTADDVYIRALTFYVDGAQTSDGSNDDAGAKDYKQPLISLFISGVTKPSGSVRSAAPFDIETAISVREIDNK